tara:strand:+ start:6010 stop:10653 length:4644 start_codon:yes stop_codon:yes gene_type:complete
MTNIYNNAGNIRAGEEYAGETGEFYYDANGKPYVIFDSPEMGLRALHVDLRSKINEFNGDITQMFIKYAPPSDNNPTNNYIDFIKNDLNKDKLTLNDLPALVRSVIKFENTTETANYYLKPQLLQTAFKLSAVGMPQSTRLSQAYDLANVSKPVESSLNELSNQELVSVAQEKIDEFSVPDAPVEPTLDDLSNEQLVGVAQEKINKFSLPSENEREPVISAVTPKPTKSELATVKEVRPNGPLKRTPDQIYMEAAAKTIDPFTHNIRFYGEAQVKDEDPSIGESFAASIGYTYAPIIEHMKNKINYGDVVDKDYNPLGDMKGYEEFGNDLVLAQNALHMQDLKRGIDENLARRRTLSNTGFFTHLFVGLADPINLVALPFGGPAVGVLRSGLRVGSGVAALQVGQEAIRAPFDPLNTATESAINIGTAFVAGNLLGGAIAVPATRRARAYKATEEAAGNQQLSLAPSIDSRKLAPTPERPFSQVTDQDVQSVVSDGPRTILRLRQMADEAESKLNAERPNLSESEIVDLENIIKNNRDAANKADNDYNLLKAEQEKRLELGERDYTSTDLSLPKNLFTDSWAFKFVTTPMKRVLQSENAPSLAKEVILGIAGDSGILLNLHKRGLTLGPSVYQKAAMRDGEWVSVYDDLRGLYGEEYGTGKQTILDYNTGDVAAKIGAKITEDTTNVSGVTNKIAAKIKAQPAQKTFVEWMTEVNVKRMKGEAPASKAEATAMSRIDEYYAQWEKRLKGSGVIGSTEYYKGHLPRLEADLLSTQNTIAKIKEKPLYKLKVRELNLLGLKANKLKDQIDDANFHIENTSKALSMPANEDVFNPRYWNQTYILDNRDKLKAILSSWYQTNPYIYKAKINSVTGKQSGWERVELDSSITATNKRADDTIDEILGIKDPTDVNAQYFGHGRSKHFKHRGIDIPNKLVVEFIETNPVNVMKTYTAKVAPQYEFMNKFNKSIDDLLDDVELSMLADGKMSGREINATLRDIRHLNDRVHGTVIRDPDALNYKSAIILKDLAMLNYLGSAGFSTLPDFAKIMMEHEMGTVWKSLFGVMSDNRVRMSSAEGRIAGEIIDILKGDAHMRFTENMKNNPLNDGYMSKIRTGFFMLNGVAPMTTIFKKMDAIARGHTLIDYSIKLVNKKASPMEVAYLARYNIGLAEATAISKAPWERTEAGLILPNSRAWENAIELPETTAVITIGEGKKVGDRYVPAFFNEKNNTITIDKAFILDDFKNKPWTSPKLDGVKALPENQFKNPEEWYNFVLTHEIMHTKFRPKKNEPTSAYENRINQLALSELSKRKQISMDTVENFRTAMNSGIMNTVLMGTPADKPIAVDGVFYVPMHVARKFGMSEDKKFKGYARIENGLLGMPFQFMSYSFAAANKITASLAQGQIKNRAVAITASMGLGYMGMELKYKDWQMEQMSWPDVIARSFDASGVAALHSDLFYTAMSISQALDGPNISGGLINPKFKQEKNGLDAALAVGGAGPSYAVDVGRGVKELLDGNYGQGANELVRRLPTAQLWFLKDEINGMGRAFAGGRY